MRTALQEAKLQLGNARRDVTKLRKMLAELPVPRPDAGWHTDYCHWFTEYRSVLRGPKRNQRKRRADPGAGQGPPVTNPGGG